MGKFVLGKKTSSATAAAALIQEAGETYWSINPRHGIINHKCNATQSNS